MSRGRFTSEELFQEEVQRLEKQRTLLLRERNFTEFTKRISRQMAPSYRESQETDQATRKNEFEWRSSHGTSSKNSPDVREVKFMLEDIIRNSEKHGMDPRTSLIYLRNIQQKLVSELRVFETNNIRSSPQIQKLRDLKLFIDRLVEYQSDPRVIYATSTEKGYRDERQGIRRGLEKIPEIPHPSIDNTSSNQGSQSLPESSQMVSDENESSEVEEVGQHISRQNPDFRKKTNRESTQTIVKKDVGSNLESPTRIIESLESKFIKQISHLRSQNARLHRQLQEHEKIPHPTNPRRLNDREDETIINRLHNQPAHRQVKHYEQQNIKLKNRIRTLEMELLNWKSLRNIGSKNDMRVTEEKLYEELELKDQEIMVLRRETQRLSEYLEQSKQNAETLREEVKQLSLFIERGHRVDNRPQILNNVRNIGDSERYVVRTVQHSGTRTPMTRQYHGAENRTDTLNRNYSNFVERRNEVVHQVAQEQLFRQRHPNKERVKQDAGKEYDGFHNDKIGEYRKLLHNLKSIKK